LRAELLLLLLALFEADALCDALFVEAEFACWAAFAEAAFVVAFAVLALLEEELTFELELSEALDCAAWLAVVASLLALFLAELSADALLAALALLAASPVLDEEPLVDAVLFW
jgi:trans-aconitate methyltransferase